MKSPHPNYRKTICFMEVQATAFLFDRLFIQGLLLTFAQIIHSGNVTNWNRMGNNLTD